MAEAKQRRCFLDLLHPRSLKHLSDSLQKLVRGRLWLKVLIGMVSGLLVGVLIGPSVGWVEPRVAAMASSWLALPGQLFLALIQMIVIPLVFASIIRGLAATESLDHLRRVGLRVVLYFIVTTAVAIVIGIMLALLLRPGLLVDSATVQATLGTRVVAGGAAPTVPAFAELPQKVLTLLPSNPLSSMVENDMLRVVIFATVVGVALVMMAPTQSRPLLDLLGSLQEVCMTVVRWAMVLAPIAVFGLLAQLTAKIGLQALVGMAAYVATVLLGLLLLFVVYLLVLYFAASQGKPGPLGTSPIGARHRADQPSGGPRGRRLVPYRSRGGYKSRGRDARRLRPGGSLRGRVDRRAGGRTHADMKAGAAGPG